MAKKTKVVRRAKKQSLLSLFLGQFFRSRALGILALAILLIALPLTIIQSMRSQDIRQRAENTCASENTKCVNDCTSQYNTKVTKCQSVYTSGQETCLGNANSFKTACLESCAEANIQCSPTACEICEANRNTDPMISCDDACNPSATNQTTPATVENGCKESIKTCIDKTCTVRSHCDDDCSYSAWGNRTCTNTDKTITPPTNPSLPPSVGAIGGGCKGSCDAQCQNKPETCYTVCYNKCDKSSPAVTPVSPKTTPGTKPGSGGSGSSGGTTGGSSSGGSAGGSSGSGSNITPSPAKQVGCSDNPIPAGENKIWKAYCTQKCVDNSICRSLPGWPPAPEASQCYPFTNGSYCIQLQYNQIAGLCRDNPAPPPSGMSWKASCSKECSKNSDCPTTPGLDNSNWCYGFDDGARCLSLQSGSVSQASPSAGNKLLQSIGDGFNSLINGVQKFFTGLFY